MRPEVGDEIIVDGPHLGDPARKGEVLEIRDRGGVEHYRVRWDDGQEGLFIRGRTRTASIRGSLAVPRIARPKRRGG